MSCSSSKAALLIAGHSVEFPYAQPYPAQLSLISKTLAALNKKQNAMLESPTGTGKSIALLCAVLAYQTSCINALTEANATGAGEQPPPEVPVIYYMSRTHTQLTQVVRELNRTSYKPKMTVLASREQYCINKTSKQSANDRCYQLRKLRMCSPFRNAFRLEGMVAQNNDIWDIEDLVVAGKQARACPYYAARSLASSAQLILCPYNYLIDPSIRSTLHLSLARSILLFDESHNIASVAREAASGTFSRQDLLMAQQFLLHEKLAVDVCTCLSGLLKLIETHETALRSTAFEEESLVFEGSKIVELLDRHDCSAGRLEAAVKALDMLSDEEQDEDFEESSSQSTNFRPALMTSNGVCHVLQLMLTPNNLRHYRFVLMRKPNSDGVLEMYLNVWCLSPSVALEPLKGSHSIVIASGTLHPLASLAEELGIVFEQKLEAPHVIHPEQVFVCALGHGPSGHAISARYQDAKTVQFQQDLGLILVELCDVVPGGVLVFFPSYHLLERLLSQWRKSKLYGELERRKSVFVEARRSGEIFDGDVKRYRDVCVEGGGNGAIFFAVCRGKLSEGIDFADEAARAVVCVGIPFPSSKDLQVELKKKHNNKERSLVAATGASKVPSGREWYCQEAFRALNQALGRCIRHIRDYGSMLLLDCRFHEGYISGNLSRWIRPHLRHVEAIHYLKPALEHFYTNMAEKYPSAPQKSSGKVRNSFDMPCKATGPLDRLLEKHAAKRHEKEETTINQESSSAAAEPNEIVPAAAAAAASANVSTQAQLDRLSRFAYTAAAASQEPDAFAAPSAPSPTASTAVEVAVSVAVASSACGECGVPLYEEGDSSFAEWEWLSELQPLLEGTYDGGGGGGGCQRDLRSMHLPSGFVVNASLRQEALLPLSPYRTVWCHDLHALFAPIECTACSHFVGAQVIAGSSALKTGDKLLLLSRLKKKDDLPATIEVRNDDIPWIDCSRNRSVTLEQWKEMEIFPQPRASKRKRSFHVD